MIEMENVYLGIFPREGLPAWERFMSRLNRTLTRISAFISFGPATILWAIAGFLFALITIKSCKGHDPIPAGDWATTEEITAEATTPVPAELFDRVYDYIFVLRIDHPDIVMAQCIEESGAFTSRLFLEGNNCLGMKVPSTRPTLAVGTMMGHARFNSWRDCITDYAIWQSTFCRRFTRDEYFAYLDRIYAEKKGYSGRLKEIILSRGL